MSIPPNNKIIIIETNDISNDTKIPIYAQFFFFYFSRYFQLNDPMINDSEHESRYSIIHVQNSKDEYITRSERGWKETPTISARHSETQLRLSNNYQENQDGYACQVYLRVSQWAHLNYGKASRTVTNARARSSKRL